MRTYLSMLVAIGFALSCEAQVGDRAPKQEVIFIAAGGSVNEPLVVLVEVASGRSSGWIPIGQRFGEYVVVSYDDQSDLLTLRRNQTVLKIRLIPGAKVIEAQGATEMATFLPDGYEVADCKVLQVIEENTGNGIYRGYLVLWQGQEVGASYPTEKPESKVGDIVRVLRMKLSFPGDPSKTDQVAFIVAPRNRPNKAPEPTPVAVTPRAAEGASK